MSKIKNKEFVFLLLITLLGAVFRFWQLGQHSLWLDELATWHSTSRATIAEMWKIHSSIELTPPPYFFAQFLFARFVDQSEFGVRLPVAIYGTLAIPMMFLFVRRAFNPAAGLVAALVFAVAYQPIYFSQEARTYSFTILLTAAAGWSWLRLRTAVESNQNLRREIVIAIAINTLLALSHYYATVMVFVQGMTFWIGVRRDRKSFVTWLTVYGTTALLFLPWVVAMTGHWKQDYGWHQAPKLNDVFLYHRWLFGSASLYGILSTLAIIAFAILWRKNRVSAPKKPKFDLILLLWVIAPFFVVYVVCLFKPIYSVRYMAVGLVPMYALTGAAVSGVAQFFWRQPKTRFASVLLILLFTGLGIHETVWARQHYSVPKAEQRREAIAYIKDELLPRFPNAYILGIGLFGKPLNDYYFERLGVGRVTDFDALGPENYQDALKDASAKQAKEIILFVPGYGVPENRFVQGMLPLRPLLEEKQFHRAGVWVFRNEELPR